MLGMSPTELAGMLMSIFVASCSSGTSPSPDRCQDAGACLTPATMDAAVDTAGDASDAAAETAVAVDAGDAAGACFPNREGVFGGNFTVDLTVNDTGFSTAVLGSTSDAQVTLTLTNYGTKPHGFEVDCASVAFAYSPAIPGCPTTSCFPASSTIRPLAPGASQTITFEAPSPDGLDYPFKSSEPADSTVPGLNDGEWNLR
jgi:hypothetical protein